MAARTKAGLASYNDRLYEVERPGEPGKEVAGDAAWLRGYVIDEMRKARDRDTALTAKVNVTVERLLNGGCKAFRARAAIHALLEQYPFLTLADPKHAYDELSRHLLIEPRSTVTEKSGAFYRMVADVEKEAMTYDTFIGYCSGDLVEEEQEVRDFAIIEAAMRYATECRRSLKTLKAVIGLVAGSSALPYLKNKLCKYEEETGQGWVERDDKVPQRVCDPGHLFGTATNFNGFMYALLPLATYRPHKYTLLVLAQALARARVYERMIEGDRVVRLEDHIRRILLGSLPPIYAWLFYFAYQVAKGDTMKDTKWEVSIPAYLLHAKFQPFWPVLGVHWHSRGDYTKAMRWVSTLEAWARANPAAKGESAEEYARRMGAANPGPAPEYAAIRGPGEWAGIPPPPSAEYERAQIWAQKRQRWVENHPRSSQETKQQYNVRVNRAVPAPMGKGMFSPNAKDVRAGVLSGWSTVLAKREREIVDVVLKLPLNILDR